jgi:murein DD-endopeptidase MepM/ murein hydrolase activator NlpD
MQAIPTEESHHRFNPSTEFAVDFFKIGADNEKTFGESLNVNDHYGYGAPVLAAANGTVAVVIADQVQNRPALLIKPGEPREAFFARVGEYHMRQMQKNFRAANAGNLVTIRHETNGAVEYTSYGHLKAGSVRVKVGDHVREGQVIAEVGDTGDAAAVHLHFQVNAGPDAFTSKSLPAVFTDQTNISGDLGYIVTAPQ